MAGSEVAVKSVSSKRRWEPHEIRSVARRLPRRAEIDSTRGLGILKSRSLSGLDDEWIGVSWESERGPRKIVSKQDRPDGSTIYFIQTGDNTRNLQILPARELARERQIDESYVAARASAKAAVREAEAKEAAADAVDGFDDGMTPMQSRKTRDALNKQVRVQRQFGSRKDHVRRLVADGFRTETTPSGRRLVHPDGRFFLESDLTKVGLDFADYLTQKSPLSGLSVARRPKSISRQRALGASFDTAPGGVKAIYWWVLGGAIALYLLSQTSAGAAASSAAQETLEEGVTSLEIDSVKALMPSGTQYIADLAFQLAPNYNVSPLTILGITYAESNFGLSLKPQGPAGTGDMIPRPAGGKNDSILSQLPGVTQQTVAIPSRGITTPVLAWVPTTEGWGHGLYQLDWASQYAYLSKGTWTDPADSMNYALSLYAANRDAIAAAISGISDIDLLRASIASYNAGRAGVIKALNAGIAASDLDQGSARIKYNSDGTVASGTRVTFDTNYVNKILGKASALGVTA